MSGRWRTVVALAALLSLAIVLQVWRDRGWQPYDPPAPLLWMQAGPAIERAALGYKSLLADMYWIRAVVYYGRQHLSSASDKNYDQLFPLLNLVTTLDPRFTVAYRFGAVFLSEQYPAGPGRPDLAVQLLQRGLQHDPARWEYPHDIGFVYFWNYRDYAAAAEWFDKASRVPGAPVWLRATAATTLAAGGDRESSRQLWRQFAETAEVSSLRDTAKLRIAQLDALDAIDALNTIVWRYEAREGHFPQDWKELQMARVLRGAPADPAGVPFVLDLENEDVRLSEASPLWPLPTGLQ